MENRHFSWLGKRSLQTVVKFAISVLLLVFLFLLLEFTGKHSSVLACISDYGHTLLSGFELPHCLSIWKQGKLTVVGCVALFVFLMAACIFLRQSFDWIRTANYQNRRGQHLKLLGSAMLLLWSIGWI